MHNEINIDSLFKGFSKEIIFICELSKICNIRRTGLWYKIYNLDLLIRRWKKSNYNKHTKYDWKIRLKEICNNFKYLNI